MPALLLVCSSVFSATATAADTAQLDQARAHLRRTGMRKFKVRRMYLSLTGLSDVPVIFHFSYPIYDLKENSSAYACHMR
jgi:hypothetical protein